MHFACWITKATLKICNAHFFSTAKMVAPTHLSVALYYIACRDRTSSKSDGVRQGGRAGRKRRLIIHSLKMLCNSAIELLQCGRLLGLARRMRISSSHYFNFQEMLTEFVLYVVSEKKTCPIILVQQATHRTPNFNVM